MLPCRPDGNEPIVRLTLLHAELADVGLAPLLGNAVLGEQLRQFVAEETHESQRQLAVALREANHRQSGVGACMSARPMCVPVANPATEQIPLALDRVELGKADVEICRKLGIAEVTCYVWRKNYGGRWHSKLKRLRQPEEGIR